MATPAEGNLFDLLPGSSVREETPWMHLSKCDGGLEPVDLNKIGRAAGLVGSWPRPLIHSSYFVRELRV
jgi:hypothetical protein